MSENVSTPVGDLREFKNYALGTLAFGATVATFLVQVFHLPIEPTVLGTTLVGVFFLIVVLLIQRSEKRLEIKLADHIDESNLMIGEFRDDMKYLKNMSLENQRSSLRTEMDNEIFRNPANHDTIIRYAYRYFKELGSDWVETEKFMAWMEKEQKAGRPVHLPADLLADINNKVALEKN